MSESVGLFQQPKPFYTIFVLELWERFGYYGLQALLAIFLVQELGLKESNSFILFGAFSALCYGLVSVGGWIGDKVLGTKRTIIIGAVLLTSGYLLMALADKDLNLIYLALGTISVGNGLFKANPSCLLAKCYDEGDVRLDGAFTIYYMSVNIGSFLSMMSVPYFSEHFGWSVGFLVSAIGLLLSLGNFFLSRKWIREVGSAADFQPVHTGKLIAVLLGSVASCFAAAWILNHLTIANILLAAVGIGVIFIFLKEIFTSCGAEQRKMTVALILMLEAIIFYVMYMQMPTSLNFFAINNVNPDILGISVNPIAFQSLNPFWIMIASPVLAWIYNRTSKTHKGLSMPGKFSLGMLCTASSFLVLPLAARFANEQGMISSNWIIVCYLLQSVGELLISGLGLAMVAQLVPERMHGFIMGAWFLTTSAASVLAGYLAGFTTTSTTNHALDSFQSLKIYSDFFWNIGMIAAVATVIMIVTVPLLNQMINDTDDSLTKAKPSIA
ncbi:Dipeptide and tripeptide permease A [invertebrate metagenome]|uniref:Dipeptide and tripeptide permease A n=1 Tax=invertebrate metagenome TaxID=1711999 RepID=A0A2H9TC35_9ZZZZ